MRSSSVQRLKSYRKNRVNANITLYRIQENLGTVKVAVNSEDLHQLNKAA